MAIQGPNIASTSAAANNIVCDMNKRGAKTCEASGLAFDPDRPSRIRPNFLRVNSGLIGRDAKQRVLIGTIDSRTL